MQWLINCKVIGTRTYIILYTYPVLILQTRYTNWDGYMGLSEDGNGLPVYGLVRMEFLIKRGILEFVIFVQIGSKLSTPKLTFNIKDDNFCGSRMAPLSWPVPFCTFVGGRHSSSRDCQKSLWQLYFAFLDMLLVCLRSYPPVKSTNRPWFLAANFYWKLIFQSLFGRVYVGLKKTDRKSSSRHKDCWRSRPRKLPRDLLTQATFANGADRSLLASARLGQDACWICMRFSDV